MKTLLLFLLLSISALAENANITLAWQQNAEPDISHYVLKIGTQPGVYTQVSNSDAPQQTIALLKDTMYYAVVTAVNTSSLESLPSKELVFQAFKPGEGKAPSIPVGLNKPVNLNASLEMSTDLKAWSVVFSKDYPSNGNSFWRVCIAQK